MPKQWRLITSDRNTSCHLPCHLLLSLPQRNNTETFMGHSKAYGIPLNSWSVQRTPWSYNHGLQEQTADNIDIYLRLFWLLASASLFSGKYLAQVYKHGAILVIAIYINSNFIKGVGMCLYQLIMHKYTYIAQLNSTTLHV